MTVQFRAPTTSEIPGIHAVWRASFEGDITRLQDDWSAADDDPLSRALIAVDENRVLAVVCIMPRIARNSAGRPELVGGIGAVATHPDARGRGYARRLLERVNGVMIARGYRWALLFTGSPEVYTRLGWRHLPQPAREGKLASGQVECGGSVTVKRVEALTDWSVLAAAYEAFNENRPLTAIRTSREWNSGVGARLKAGPLFVVESGAEIIGYASAMRAGKTVELREIANRPECPAVIGALERAVTRWAIAHGCSRGLAYVPCDIALDSLIVEARPAHHGYAMAHALDSQWVEIEAAAQDPSGRFWLADAF